MAEPNRTMLDRADVGPVVAPAAHTHGKSEIGSHADSHAEGGSDPVSPESIGAPDVEQVSGSYYNLSGTSTTFGPGRAESIGTAVNKVSSALGLINMQFSTKADKTHATQHATGGSDPITPDDIGAPDAEQVSGVMALEDGTRFDFGPGKAFSNGAAIAVSFSLSAQARDYAQAAVTKDTGWRKVTYMSAWAPDFVADKEHIRRVGNQVTYTGQISTFPAGTYFQASAVVGTGFRPPVVMSAAGFPLSRYPGSAAVEFAGSLGVNSSGTLTFKSAPGVSNTLIYFSVTWLTDGPWPSTLPGTPA